jgi:hypothetical protein
MDACATFAAIGHALQLIANIPAWHVGAFVTASARLNAPFCAATGESPADVDILLQAVHARIEVAICDCFGASGIGASARRVWVRGGSVGLSPRPGRAEEGAQFFPVGLGLLEWREMPAARGLGHAHEGAQVAFGDGHEQRLVARAAVHDLTVASRGPKRFTCGRNIFGRSLREVRAGQPFRAPAERQPARACDIRSGRPPARPDDPCPGRNRGPRMNTRTCNFRSKRMCGCRRAKLT